MGPPEPERAAVPARRKRVGDRVRETLEADLAALEDLSYRELRQRFEVLYGTACRAKLSRRILRYGMPVFSTTSDRPIGEKAILDETDRERAGRRAATHPRSRMRFLPTPNRVIRILIAGTAMFLTTCGPA